MFSAVLCVTVHTVENGIDLNSRLSLGIFFNESCKYDDCVKCFFIISFRRALRRGESVRFLIQDDVISYIKDNGLYSCPDK